MKILALGSAIPGQEIDWLEKSLRTIERATNEDVQAVLVDFEVSNFTETRTLTGASSTADIANFICTIVDELKRRDRGV